MHPVAGVVGQETVTPEELILVLEREEAADEDGGNLLRGSL